MPKYKVTLKETVEYEVIVDAFKSWDAEALACEIWAESEDPTNDFSGTGYGVRSIGCKLVNSDEK